MPASASPSATCPRCGRPTEVTEAAESAMQADDVVVRVAGLARATCDAGHVTLLPASAAPAAQAAVDHQLQVARERGVVRRRRACGDCGATLVLPAWRSERPVPVDVDGRVLTICVQAAMVRCPDCAREQLTPAAAAVLPSVLAAAVDAVAGPG